MRFENLYSVLPLLLLFLNCKGCMEEERDALLQIRSSTNNPEGTAFSNWYGEDCCHWEGVECDVSNSYVIKIIFHYRMKEQSSTEKWHPNATLFAQFKGLQELHLPGNQIEEFIAPNALHELKYLQKVDLRDNLLADGSHLCWGNMPSLHFLDLSRNKFHGDIPKCLCDSQSLRELQLSNNQLQGNIDACFSNITTLRYLDLSSNLFNGTFPSSLFHNLPNIESFIISRNKFNDAISLAIFANLSKLKHLDISFNADLEIETESPVWSPSFNLNQLKLAACNLNKQTGKRIPSFISTQYHLQYLDLSYNSLVGSIPLSLLFNVSSELRIRGNNLSGSFPRSQGNMSSQLAVLDVSENLLYGSLPAAINSILPELRHLNASRNNFVGSLPESFGAMKQLQILDLSQNDFEGKIPHSMKSNITSFQYLRLSGNNLQGEALPRNSSWCNLRWLFLERNHFTGLSLDGLSKCSSLLMLSIHSNAFSGELSRNFPVFPQLRLLILRENHFEGRIPLQVCQMKHLNVLDLSQNDLSGDVPTCLDNITSWTEESVSNHFDSHSWFASVDLFFDNRFSVLYYDLFPLVPSMDVSSNKLTGAVSLQISKLKAILWLNMSNNLLTGPIPTLANLSYLESLDLSNNKFFGALPPHLDDNPFLVIFNVSFNNLSGPIPSATQFSTFDNSSYLGNPNLCGKPLKKKCFRELVGSPSVKRSPSVKGSPSNLCSVRSISREPDKGAIETVDSPSGNLLRTVKCQDMAKECIEEGLAPLLPYAATSVPNLL
ncbi:unnamed protein product [Dovyalis caffra]|uniref:Leucine-rich repeat-containing N-terminal plant-type domain-containing protein n=1 Tax=Dovyalis caffra TaxID=77055 RepID=A0AAV1QXF4_9ROSI|nr:unnamed protein product [Dovyalis caffra]